MRPSFLFSALFLCTIIMACGEQTANQSAPVGDSSHSVNSPQVMNISDIPAYVPRDSALYRDILVADKRYFDAYNSCDLETQADMLAEGFEFYHDQGGLMTDKESLIKSIKDNICDKVTRTFVPGSMEVYEIPGYGAVAEGYHSFFNNQEPDAPQKPSKFITIWKQTDAGWKFSRIVSLH